MSDKKINIEIGGAGPGLVVLLTITFVILKALGHLAWSWWWVFSPLWIPPVVVAGVLLAAGVGIGAVFGVAKLLDWNKARCRRKKLRAGR